MVILAILAVLWAGVIFTWVRERAHDNRGDSTHAFRQQLSTLSRTHPGARRSTGFPAQVPGAQRAVLTRRSAADAAMRRRRRDVLTALVGASLITFLFAAFVGSLALILLNAVCVIATVGYVVLLAQQQQLAQERRQKVRYLPGAAAPARAAYRQAEVAMAVGEHRGGRPMRPARLGAEAAAMRRPATN